MYIHLDRSAREADQGTGHCQRGKVASQQTLPSSLAEYFRALLIFLTVDSAIAVSILLEAELEKTFDAALRCFHTLIEVASNVCFWHFADIHADSEHVRS